MSHLLLPHEDPTDLPEGDTHPLAMLTPSGLVLADDYAELVDAAFPGYAEVQGETESAWQRYLYALGLAHQLNGALLSDLGEGAAALTEDEANQALRGDASLEPFTGHWPHAHPLVLVRSDYHPHTRVPVPTGHVRMLDPTTETSLIGSLVEAGIVEVFARNDTGD